MILIAKFEGVHSGGSIVYQEASFAHGAYRYGCSVAYLTRKRITQRPPNPRGI